MDKQRTEHTSRKCFRCGYEDHLFAKCPKPPKDNERWRNQVRLRERGNHALQKECENVDNYNYQKIYAYMVRRSGNDEIPSRDFGDSSK